MDIIQKIAFQMIQGLSFIHDKLKIVHTDLKPENVLFVFDNYICIKKNKILDLAKQLDICERSITSNLPEIYQIPINPAIKIIDFGAATLPEEEHWGLINTRQYRAPEVILDCCDWNEKSDIWGLACILVEIYCGSLLFPTHHTVEHMLMIEKISGPLPDKMVSNSNPQRYGELFDLDINCTKNYYRNNPNHASHYKNKKASSNISGSTYENSISNQFEDGKEMKEILKGITLPEIPLKYKYDYINNFDVDINSKYNQTLKSFNLTSDKKCTELLGKIIENKEDSINLNLNETCTFTKERNKVNVEKLKDQERREKIKQNIINLKTLDVNFYFRI